MGWDSGQTARRNIEPLSTTESQGYMSAANSGATITDGHRAGDEGKGKKTLATV